MKATIFKNLSYGNYGDHVICNDCGKEMIVPIGTEICPCCGSVGCMEWANQNEPEVELYLFKDTHEIINENAEYTKLFE